MQTPRKLSAALPYCLLNSISFIAFILSISNNSNAHFFQKNRLTQSIQEFISGAVIGAVISSLFYPINVIKVSMQSSMGTARISMLTAFRNVYNERGRSIGNVYKGVTVNCSRAFISWGIMNTAYEHIKQFLHDEPRATSSSRQ